MGFLSMILMSVALSIDGLGVGLAYGVRGIKIKLFHIVLISCSAAFVMGISILLGQVIKTIIPDDFDRLIGGTILLLIGLWQLIEGWKRTKLKNLKESGCQSVVLVKIKIKLLGIILQVVCDPREADLDHSGDIDFKEAILLGIALNIDALGAGIGAGVAGFSMILAPISALFLFVSLLLGLYIGKNYISSSLKEKSYLFTALILILIGMKSFI
ncbi:sporulation membrane protein YtaF [Haloplasma contractile]|uniref:Membrane protein putative n=1 Tax=Haloplasma contractile SSD-17B TaxID=1033810 RepID=F7PW01_9MOLU|nr:sporulation membrane protein YtaF [Haloplasma contractile]ERJ12675.1 Membrane protein putative [Haloplasma contractile SSD-17B]